MLSNLSNVIIIHTYFTDVINNGSENASVASGKAPKRNVTKFFQLRREIV